MMKEKERNEASQKPTKDKDHDENVIDELEDEFRKDVLVF